MWVTYGTTESGDDLQVVIWKKEPLDEAVDNYYQITNEIEYEEIGYVLWKKAKAEIEE
jgi:hypothetical protein